MREGNKIKVWFDGGSRAASSKTGYGGLIYVNDKKVRTVHEFIGAETNNAAELAGLQQGLWSLKFVSRGEFADFGGESLDCGNFR